MHGGRRPKETSFWTSVPGAEQLVRRCDGSHDHLPWAVSLDRESGWQFSTAEEAAYPHILCQRYAALVARALEAKVPPPAPSPLEVSPGFVSVQATAVTQAAGPSGGHQGGGSRVRSSSPPPASSSPLPPSATATSAAFAAAAGKQHRKARMFAPMVPEFKNEVTLTVTLPDDVARVAA